jgi:phage tail protein X
MRVTSLPGDTLDKLLHRHVGAAGDVAKVLRDTPGLADLGPVLPVGTEIDLSRDDTSTQQAITLW